MPYKNPEDRKAFRDKHKEKKAAYDRQYRKDNKERRASQVSAWVKKNLLDSF